MIGTFWAGLSRLGGPLLAELDWLYRNDDAAAARLRALHLNYVNRLTPLLAAVSLANASLLLYVMGVSAGWLPTVCWTLSYIAWAALVMRGWF